MVRASPADVWAVASDPYQLARWWPNTMRVEGVTDDAWTSVLSADRGRSVRADYRLEASEPPRLRRWSQEVAGTPFERLFAESVVELRVAPADGGTDVALELRQRPRGWARFGVMVLRRAGTAQLDEALAGLAGLVEP